VKKLATKSIRKRKKFNKKALANKLDSLAKKVAKRNVSVVKKSDPGYDIIDYVNKKTCVENVPFLNIAERACKSFNKSTEPVNDKYFKHYMDLQFYKYTIKTSEDKVKVFTAGVRMQTSLDMIKEAKKHLYNF
jgi:hypothetical protein